MLEVFCYNFKYIRYFAFSSQRPRVPYDFEQVSIYSCFKVTFRDACKIKIAHILSLRDNSKIAPPPPCLKVQQNERFFFMTPSPDFGIPEMFDFFTRHNKKLLIFGIFETIRFWSPPTLPRYLEETNYERHFFLQASLSWRDLLICSREPPQTQYSMVISNVKLKRHDNSLQ